MLRNKETVIEILTRRDNITQRHAELRYEETRAKIEQALSDKESHANVDDILMNELGLEPDYIEAFVNIVI